MPYQMGYAVTTSPKGKAEQDLYVCGHCQKVVTCTPGQQPEDAGGLCKLCNRLVCLTCYQLWRGGAGCEVFEKKLDRAERRAVFLNSVGV